MATFPYVPGLIDPIQYKGAQLRSIYYNNIYLRDYKVNSGKTIKNRLALPLYHEEILKVLSIERKG